MSQIRLKGLCDGHVALLKLQSKVQMETVFGLFGVTKDVLGNQFLPRKPLFFFLKWPQTVQFKKGQKVEQKSYDSFVQGTFKMLRIVV